MSGEDGILVAEVPHGVQHASLAQTSPRLVVGWPDPINWLVMLCPNFDQKAAAQGQSGDGIKLYVFLSPEYIAFWALVHTCWNAACVHPLTKRNESLRNITWHPQTKTKDYGTMTKIRTQTQITNAPTTPVTIGHGVVEWQLPTE